MDIMWLPVFIEYCYGHHAHFLLHSPHQPSTQHPHAIHTSPFREFQIPAEARAKSRVFDLLHETP